MAQAKMWEIGQRMGKGFSRLTGHAPGRSVRWRSPSARQVGAEPPAAWPPPAGLRLRTMARMTIAGPAPSAPASPLIAPAPLRIGRLQVDSPVLIAPMVGITDGPFRRLAREFGAGLVSAEMTAAEPVVRRIPRTLELLTFDPGVRPVAAQLVGCDPAMMAEAAVICVERGASVVDVNLGCPVPRVTTRGSGAALARGGGGPPPGGPGAGGGGRR